MAGNPREIGWSESSDSEGDIDMEEAHDAQLAHNPATLLVTALPECRLLKSTISS